MRIIGSVSLLLVFLIGLTFACLNADPVVINYYVASARLPLSLLLALAFGLGCLLSLMVAIIMFIRLKASNIRLHNRLKLAEKEVNNLRAMPLQDNH